MSKKILLAFVAAFLLACNALIPQAPTATQPTVESDDIPEFVSTSITIVRLHPQTSDLKTRLAQEAPKAIALGQIPVVEFDATWCGACQAIDQGLKSKNELMLKAYAGTYIIKLNVDEWGWGDSRKHDFEFDGIPIYFKLDAQGHPTGEVIDGNAWGDNIPENIAPPMDEFFHGK